MKVATKVAAQPNLWALVMEKLCAYWLLSKPRVTLLVSFSTAAGLILGGLGHSLETGLILATLIGSWLVIASANALNQVIEWRTDAQHAGARHRARFRRVRWLYRKGWLVATVWGVMAY
jgi:heme O synthase-like polyprenyltransferase